MFQATIRTYKNAYSGLSRETWLLSLIMLINRSGTMVIPFMTLYLTSPEMGYSISKAGIVFGLFGAGAFSGAWFGGRLTDKIGFYPVQWVTLLGGGILFIVLGQMKTYPLICVFTFLLSFVNESFRPANSTAIAFYSKESNRTRSYALNRLAINLGWAVGVAVGGVLAELNYEYLFWVDGITNISAALLIWMFLKPVKAIVPHRDRIKETIKQLPAYLDRQFMYFILFTTLFAACFFQIFTNLPVYFRKDLHLSEGFIGFIMSINGVMIAILEMVFVYKMEGKRRNISLISLGVFFVGLSFLSLNLPGITGLYLLLMICIVTIGEIFAMPFMNTYWIARTKDNNRGQYAAMYTMAWSAAQTLGPMGAAALADVKGFHFLWWIVGGCCIFCAFLFRRLQ
ncbi:MAG: MFS transporter [Chitinophagaceae bacterium]|nr:MFS transporter [Chitinophagaceae bacterium]